MRTRNAERGTRNGRLARGASDCGDRHFVPRSAFRLPRSSRGFGLIELLISLALTASLLTALGVAVHASTKSYTINEDQAVLTLRARSTLYRMLTMIRTTSLHSPETSAKATSFTGGATVNDIGITMFSPSGSVVVYHFDATKSQLKVTDGGSTRVLLNDVADFQVTMQPMRSPTAIKTGGNFDLLQRATIQLTVRTSSSTALPGEDAGASTLTFSSSVMPRRNVW